MSRMAEEEFSRLASIRDARDKQRLNLLPRLPFFVFTELSEPFQAQELNSGGNVQQRQTTMFGC